MGIPGRRARGIYHMRLYLYILSASLAFGQSQSELKIIPKQDDSATGIIKFQEKYGSGLNYVGVRAPSSIPANVTWTLPSADGTSGQCLQTDGSGQWGWAACIINGGNTTGATLTIGTNDAQTLSLETNGTGRWSIPITGHLYAGANNTYDIGAGISANSPRSIYAATSMVAPAFSAIDSSGSYMRAQKFEIHMDATGTAFFSVDFASSNTMDLLDTASGVIQRWDRNTSDVSFDAHVWPRGTTETRNLGTTGARWLAINTKNLNLSGNVTSNLTPSGTRYLGATGSEWNELFVHSITATSIVEPKVDGGAQNGDTSKRWSATYTQDLNASGTITFPTGAASGYVWTSNGSGVGSWQAASGAALPVVDTTGIAKGSSDATKIVRFEVDGFTSGVTNVLTPQNNSYTLAGTNIAQTFSSTQTFSGTLVVSGTVGDDFIPNSNGTYVNGTTSFRWGSIATYNADFNGVLTLQSGSTITGSILPTTNNLYALGNTSYRMSNVATVNMNLSGTVTAPNGNTGLSSTRTVGDGSGGSCTITISGGIITASTCP